MNSNNDDMNNEMDPQQGQGNADPAGEESINLDSGRPAVASAPGKIMVFIIAAVIFVAIVVKSLFFSTEAPVVENKIKMAPERVVSDSRTTAGVSAGELPTPAVQEPVGSFSSRNISAFDTPGKSGSATDFGRLTPPGTGPGSRPAPSAAPLAIPAPSLAPGLSPSVIAPPTISAPAIPSISAPVTPGAAGGVNLPPPPPPPGLAAPAMPDVKTSLPRDEAAMKRLQSDMVSYGGGAGASAKSTSAKPSNGGASFVGNDPNSQFANNVIANSASQSVTAQRIDNLRNTIVEGKIVHSVLETAINSDLPGTLRAVISHDVYAEAGRAILIPKGSRLLGTYNASVKKGQNRVFVVWTRVVRPDGITIMIGSPGVDALGRAGIEGDVDNKYLEMFSNAALTSSMTIGVAAIGEALFGDDQSSTTTTDGGGSTTTTSPSGQAMKEAVDNIGQVGRSIVGAALGLTPTIYVDQGTPINVFVNKELVFPPELSNMLISIN